MISTGTDGPAFGDGLAAEVVHGAYATARLAGHDGVADADGAALDQHGDDHAATDVDLGFDDGAAGRRVGVGLEVGDVGDELQHVEEVVEPDVLLGAGFDEHRVAAPLLGHDAELGELLLDLVDVGVGLVDLVDDDDDRHFGRLGVVDGLDRLRHDAVVGRHHDGRDVGDLGAACAHRGEGFVARRVEERDGLAVVLYLVGADVLRDAAGLAGRHLGLADGVEEARLAVVDVTHHGDHRRAPLEVLGAILGGLHELGLVVGRVGDLDRALEVVGEDGDRLVGQRLRDGGHLAVAHHRLDDVGGRDAEQLRDVLDAGARRHLDLLAFDGRPAEWLRRARPAGGGRGGRGGRSAARGRDATPERRSPRGGGGCRRRPGRARRAPPTSTARRPCRLRPRRPRVWPVGELHAGAPEVGEHVGDRRAALLRDLSDWSHAGHLPHRLSLLADVGEAPAQIVVDGHARAQGAIERAPALRLFKTVGLWAQPGATPHGVPVGEHDASAAAASAARASSLGGDLPATDAGASRCAGLDLRRHSAVTCPPVSASASFRWAGMPQ